MKIKALLSLCILLSAMTATAQTLKPLTLEHLIPGGKNYWDVQPQNISVALWGDIVVEVQTDKVLARNDEKGRATSPRELFTLERLNSALSAAGQVKAHSLSDVSFPYPGKTLAKVQTEETVALYDWAAHKIEWHAPLIPDAVHSDWSAASRSTAFCIYPGDLYVQTADGKEIKVSTDGSRDIVYGQSVHRDEWGIHKGTFWSPTGAKLAFYRMDQSMVTDYPLVDVSKRVAQYIPEKYPMAGMTSHKVSVGIFTPSTGQTVYLQTGDPTDRYFTNIVWSPDEKHIYMIELPRSQDKAELVEYSAADGARLRVLYTETNSKYVHPDKPIAFLPWDSDKFLYHSERDGYNHLYLMSLGKGEIRQLTSGKFVVSELVGFNPSTKSVIIRSTEASHLQKNTYSVSIASGKRTPLDSGTGVHYATLSASGSTLIDRYSSPTVPRSVGYISTKTAARTDLLTAAEPLEGYATPEITSGSIKAADGTTNLYYRLIKPIGFEEGRRYPTIVYVYGGPNIRNVEASRQYATRGWEIHMAGLGYVVFVLDNRGSTDRGFEFESVTHLRLGQEEMRDQICGVEFLKQQSFVDSTRLGVHGWSYGGFMTISLMTTYPDVFKAGVAGGPVTDWKYYEVMYGERFMSTPQKNPDGYSLTSVINKAGNLKGRLQVIHGYNDPVCVPQHALEFMSASIKAGTQPDLFLYPGQGHNMQGRSRVHLHHRITNYFEEHLK